MSNQHISVTSPQAFDHSCIQVAAPSISQACKPTQKKYTNSGDCPVCHKWQSHLSKHKSRCFNFKRPPPTGRRARCTNCAREWSAKNTSKYGCACNAQLIFFDPTSVAQIPASETVGSGSQNRDDDQPFCAPQNSSGGANDPTAVTALTHRNTKRQRKLPSVYLLCVGTSAVKDIGKSDLLGVPVDLSDIEVFKDELGVIFQREEISRMQRELGKAFIRRVTGEPIIHQTIVSMLFARAKDHVEADFKPWDWLISEIQKDSLGDYITKKKASRVLILLSNTTSEWRQISVSDLYSHLRRLSVFDGRLCICPSEVETQWAGCKIGDISTLDRIARDAEWKYSYRPRTCLGRGKCTLPSTAVKKMVVKRGYSCGAGDVEVVDGTQRHNLRCIDTEQSHPGPYNTNIDIRKPTYFHQEYIESLQTIGEYRVYICREKILAIAHTKFNWDSTPKHFAVQRVQLKSFAWFSRDPKEQQKKLEELKDYALFMNSRLLELSDIREEYRSLRVGVRLDIGFSEVNRNGRPFISENTRFPMADHLASLVLDKPYFTISQEWAESLIEEYTRDWRGKATM
ncbi:hypothetical protein FOXG_21512 [Fusarium oxysporum f. sp. lycopersici 4287]|uniref:Uncharacterized protein n=1 Tax=Fusarium oxysporum f. sp. lycopersici (strain 4287 / CBS 123668 / FGSC 9935 / NRRL 34936) TaxID=426428 RepID=A0A0J9VZB7_FUSO4|nr:hypothetical protein FOXG_21512 [Fusarium oxysporum f. sp. lycopersici 4287]EWZ78776.1 hypothetical protein FOWG_17025 [Fusarium oxysporum f. sp. lycopersici MN25]KAJ9413579.1 hypothetical protein QL093DRAFT_1106937 [Fusarium oxysporum]KNB15855.1 hypothetical protein FOXG_21512 [Fusarium oxysporum f. sp. lycopersici 4287]